MKNRKMLYLLFPAVILIWGFVVYNILSHIRSSDISYEEMKIPMINSSLTNDSNQYTLIANYRDPFYTGSIANKDESQDHIKSIEARPTEQPVIWPAIEYLGLIINNKKYLGLLKINNVNQLMMESENRSDVKLIKLYSDSVILNFQGKTKCIIRSQKK
jgi:hypothetical protein